MVAVDPHLRGITRVHRWMCRPLAEGRRPGAPTPHQWHRSSTALQSRGPSFPPSTACTVRLQKRCRCPPDNDNGLIAAAFSTVASLGAAGALPAFADSSSTDVSEPFSAHSGDACRMGVAKGTILWHVGPAGRTVDGKVAVADRPVPKDPAPGCRDDGRVTSLSLIAWASGQPVDRVLLGADNGERE